jgi:hypothetical protein
MVLQQRQGAAEQGVDICSLGRESIRQQGPKFTRGFWHRGLAIWQGDEKPGEVIDELMGEGPERFRGKLDGSLTIPKVIECVVSFHVTGLLDMEQRRAQLAVAGT